MIRLLVGLGNPGARYEATRHNAGFWWIDAVARQLGATLQAEAGWFGKVARINRPLAGVEGPIWLLEPMTFMNLSGQSVAALARFYKIAPDEILVVHDELDLPPGQARIKFGGGSGGHNGLKDILAKLGTADHWRLRLGIGHPGVNSEVVNYVLEKPSLDDQIAIALAIDQSKAALDLMLAGDLERATMKVHAKPPRPKPPRTEPSPQPIKPAEDPPG